MGHKVIEGSTAAFAALSTLPQAIRDLVLVIVLFIAIDTLTGVWLAKKRAELRSKSMKDHLIAKCFQYAGFGVLGLGVTILSHSMAPFASTLGMIAGIESLSIIENLVGLEKWGVPMGPARPLLLRMSRYLAAHGEDRESMKATEETDRIMRE